MEIAIGEEHAQHAANLGQLGEARPAGRSADSRSSGHGCVRPCLNVGLLLPVLLQLPLNVLLYVVSSCTVLPNHATTNSDRFDGFQLIRTDFCEN